jgi:DNA-binding NarL/FixJ family response regulator
MQNLRILIVDDSRPWVNLLQTILSKEPLHEVISIAFDGDAALIEAERLNPDLMLLDVNLPTISGLDLAASLQNINPRPLVLFVSQNSNPSIVRAALEAGGKGYLLKTDADQELMNAIRAVCAGERYLSTSLRDSIVDW